MPNCCKCKRKTRDSKPAPGKKTWPWLAPRPAAALFQVRPIAPAAGEFVGTPPGEPLVILGDITRLHVRVDIDEHDLPRLRPSMNGQAFVRGEASRPLALSFVRIEPFAQPKRSLTGAGNERIDTRVLQVIYAIDEAPLPVYVGQQVDVYLDAAGS
jgi:HlyD family secretion protein